MLKKSLTVIAYLWWPPVLNLIYFIIYTEILCIIILKSWHIVDTILSYTIPFYTEILYYNICIYWYIVCLQNYYLMLNNGFFFHTNNCLVYGFINIFLKNWFVQFVFFIIIIYTLYYIIYNYYLPVSVSYCIQLLMK